jgi:hypothetical protein
MAEIFPWKKKANEIPFSTNASGFSTIAFSFRVSLDFFLTAVFDLNLK